MVCGAAKAFLNVTVLVQKWPTRKTERGEEVKVDTEHTTGAPFYLETMLSNLCCTHSAGSEV